MKWKVIIVSAIKGGTGKTLVSLNLAKRLSEKGKTGLIDADVDSSNFSEFTGSNGMMEINEAKKTFVPYSWDGVEVFSMSLLANKEKAVSMTGDRYSQILRDAIENTEWSDLDYLVVDLPSGAGDIFRETIYLLGDDLVGGVIVTIPSCVVDAKRVIRLHQLNEIPIIGIIENMAWFECDKCKEKYDIFGKTIAEELAKEAGVPFLGRIPLSSKIMYGVANKNPIFDDSLAEPIIKAVNAIVESKKTGLLTKLRKSVSETVKEQIEKLIVTLVITINKTVDISSMQQKYGYTEKKPFEFIITDKTGEKVITRAKMRLDEGKLVVLKGDVKPNFQVVTDISTVARIAYGAKSTDGKLIPYDAFDAWLNGDIRVYGKGTTTRAVQLARKLFSDEAIIGIRDKFPILKKFI